MAYILARGVPGIVAFLAIPVFTSVLDPADYGRYAIAVAALNVANSLLFQWIRLAIVRFFPTDDRLGGYTSTIVTLWCGLTAGVGVVVGLALLSPHTASIGSVLALGWLVLAAQSLFDIVTEFSRAALRPWHYMAMQMLRAASLVGLGYVLLRAGVGWTAPLIAVTAGMALAIGWAWRGHWRHARLHVDRATARDLIGYGVPVSLTVALVSVTFVVDRTLVAAFLGDGAAGIYSVAFDFTTQSVTLVMMAASMAAYPVAVRAYESGGVAAARGPMSTNAILIVAVGVPTATGAAVLAPGIADTLFGAEYYAAAEIFPLVALSALLAALKAYHFDAALQLARRTGRQVWIASATVLVSVALNLLLLPLWGLTGAALAAALTFFFSLVVTAWVGRKYCALPFPIRMSLEVLLAGVVMALALLPFRHYQGAVALAAQVVAAVAVYVCALIALGCVDPRRRAVVLLRFGKGTSGSTGTSVPPRGGSVCMYAPFASGGHPRYVAEVMHALAAEAAEGGPSVELVSSEDLTPAVRTDRYAVHPVLPALRSRADFRTGLGWVVSRTLHYIRRDVAFLKWLRGRPDIGIVHFQELSPGIGHHVVERVRRRGIAVFITVHNVRPHHYPPLIPRWLVDRSVRQAYLKSDCLFVHGVELSHELNGLLRGAGAVGGGEPRICVVDHGVWTVEGHAPPNEAQLRARLGRKRLLFFGAIRRNKGLHILLEAAATGQLSAYSITIAGEPDEDEYFQRTVLPLVERVRAAGVPVRLLARFVPDDEVGRLFDEHSALVLPYTPEFRAQSGVAFLALAHGLPVVATSAGGLRQLMVEYRIGEPVVEATAEEVAAAVHRLMKSANDDVSELVAGMRAAVDGLSWSGMARATLAEYRRVRPTSPADARIADEADTSVHLPGGRS